MKVLKHPTFCCLISLSSCQLLAWNDENIWGLKGLSHFLTDAPWESPLVVSLFVLASSLYFKLTDGTNGDFSTNAGSLDCLNTKLFLHSCPFISTVCSRVGFSFLSCLPKFICVIYVSVCSNDFSRMVAEEYLSFFSFTGLTLDQALR